MSKTSSVEFGQRRARSRSVKNAIRLVAPLAVCVISLSTVACSQPSHAFSEEQYRLARIDQSLTTNDLSGLSVYFDTTTSMRGFALGATANEVGAPNEFQSVLTAIDSLSSALSRGKTNVSNSSGPIAAVSRFGGSLEPMAQPSLLTAALGRGDFAKIGGQRLEPESLSQDCGASRWGGSPSARARLDSFYSERVTCLNAVFDEVLKDRSGTRAHVIITDAEQSAPTESVTCPSAKNMGTIQANLFEWIRRGGYVSVIAFRVRTLAWKSALESRQYCDCQSKQLYAYLLTPSAEHAETVYGHFAGLWKGEPSSIAYLPFAPRPASQFQVSMSIPVGAGSPRAQVPESPAHFLQPEQGMLPQFWIQLNSEEAEIAFSVQEVAFEDWGRQDLAGFMPADRNKAEYQWQVPFPLAIAKAISTAAPEQRATNKGDQSSTAIASPITVREPRGLEFIELPPITSEAAGPGARPDIVRMGHYNSRAKVISAEGLTKELSTVRLRLRKRPGNHENCELFMVQLDTRLSTYVDNLFSSHPFVTNALPACSSMDSLSTQMRFVYRQTPVVRFLLHVDY